MKLTSIVKATFLPLTLLFLAIGCVLILVGGVNMFMLEPRQVARDGLNRQLDFFADCNLKAQQELPGVRQRIAENRTGETGSDTANPQANPGVNPQRSTGADVGIMLAERCNGQQRPYKWLLLFTGSSVGLTFLMLIYMIYKAPSGLLSWLGIQTAIVISLVVLSIYAGMQLETQRKDLVDCQGYDSPAKAEVEQLGFTCYESARRPNSLKELNHWATIFWVGTGFSLAGLGMLMTLVPLMHWAKIKLLRTGEADPEEGDWTGRDLRYGDTHEHHVNVHDREAQRRQQTQRERERGGPHAHAYPSDTSRYASSDRNTDRWGSGRAGTAGGLTGARGAHERDRDQRNIRERERERARERAEHETERDRYPSRYGPSDDRTFWEKMTGAGGGERDYSHQGRAGTGVEMQHPSSGQYRDRFQEQSLGERVMHRDQSDPRGFVDRTLNRPVAESSLSTTHTGHSGATAYPSMTTSGGPPGGVFAGTAPTETHTTTTTSRPTDLRTDRPTV